MSEQLFILLLIYDQWLLNSCFADLTLILDVHWPRGAASWLAQFVTVLRRLVIHSYLVRFIENSILHTENVTKNSISTFTMDHKFSHKFYTKRVLHLLTYFSVVVLKVIYSYSGWTYRLIQNLTNNLWYKPNYQQASC